MWPRSYTSCSIPLTADFLHLPLDTRCSTGADQSEASHEAGLGINPCTREKGAFWRSFFPLTTHHRSSPPVETLTGIPRLAQIRCSSSYDLEKVPSPKSWGVCL